MSSIAAENVIIPDGTTVLDFPGDEKKFRKMQVSKTDAIRNLVKSSLSLNQLKLLDLYLARINSHNPAERFVRISSGDLKKFFHTSHIDPAYMRALVEGEYDKKGKLVKQGLLGFPVHFDDAVEAHTEVLFSTARYRKDAYGVYCLTLGCSEEAKKYIFFEKGIHYLRTKLHFLINLKSRYSYALYYYILSHLYNRRPRAFEVSIDDLRTELHAIEGTYKEFKRFHTLILKPAVKEVNEKTDVRVDYEVIKRGTRAVGIRFNVTCVLNWERAVDYLDSGIEYAPGQAELYVDDQAEQDWEDRCIRGDVTLEEVKQHYGLPQNPSQFLQEEEDNFMAGLDIVRALEHDRKVIINRAQRRYHAQKDESEKNAEKE